MDTTGKVVIIYNNHHSINKVDKFSKAAEDIIDSKMSIVFPYCDNFKLSQEKQKLIML